MKQARVSTNWHLTTTTPLFAHKASKIPTGFAGALTFVVASPAEAMSIGIAMPIRLLGLLDLLDNLDITNNPLLSHQAFFNATLSVDKPTGPRHHRPPAPQAPVTGVGKWVPVGPAPAPKYLKPEFGLNSLNSKAISGSQGTIVGSI